MFDISDLQSYKCFIDIIYTCIQCNAGFELPQLPDRLPESLYSSQSQMIWTDLDWISPNSMSKVISALLSCGGSNEEVTVFFRFLKTWEYGPSVTCFLLMCLINFVHYYDSMTDLLQCIYIYIYILLLYVHIHIISLFLLYMIFHYMFEHICFIECLPKDAAKVLSICQVSLLTQWLPSSCYTPPRSQHDKAKANTTKLGEETHCPNGYGCGLPHAMCHHDILVAL